MKKSTFLGKPGGKLLLLDSNTTTRDLRTRVMQNLGMDVDAAADTAEALLPWRPDFYDLVVVDLRSAPLMAQRFCDEIRSASPTQRVAYFVGKPLYLASSPGDGEAPEVHDFGEWGRRVRNLFEEACEQLPQQGSLLEAAWRISAKGSLNDPRTKEAALPAARLALSFGEAIRLAQISQAVPL